MENYMRNIDNFLEGITEIWTLYKFNGSKKWNDKFALQHYFPKCKKEYYDSIFELQDKPTMDYAIKLRKFISDKQKEYYRKKQNQKNDDNSIKVPSDEEIKNAINVLKSTGGYIIKKKVVTITYEEV